MSLRRCSPVLVAAGALAGCMGGGDSDEGTIAAAPRPRPERAFAELRVAFSREFDYVDPALAFTKESWSLLWHVYLPLVTFAHARGEAGARPVPALAEALPDISEDALTYTFRVREGITYSDGTRVRARDFAYAIERLLRMGATGSSLFAAIDGAQRVAAGKDERLPGIATDDEERIVEFRLSRPQPEFLQVLATPLAAPVPQGTKEVEQAERPVPATGPYAVAAFEPGERVVLVRNRRYRAIPDVPTGNPDRIVVSLGGGAGRRADYGAGKPVASEPLPATEFVFLNTSRPPFDRLSVRRAVALALDRRALAKAAGKPAAPASQLIPPGVAGFEGGEPPAPRLEDARLILARARVRNRRVDVWTSSEASSRRPGFAVVGTLLKLGLRARLRQLPPEEYVARVTGRRSRVQAGIASWTAPVPHPRLWIEPLVNGDRLTELPNTNLAHVDDPALNDNIAELMREPELSTAVANAWAAVDQAARVSAVVVPFAHPRAVHRLGTRVDRDCLVPHVVFGVDLIRLCVRD